MLYHAKFEGGDAMVTALRRLHGKELDIAAMEGLTRYAHSVRSRAAASYRSKGIGKHLSGHSISGRTDGLPLRVGKPRETSSGYRIDVIARGFVAMQEMGGRTEAHEILPKHKDALKFVGTGGEPVFADSVLHPGGPVHADPSVWPAIEDSAEEFTRTMGQAVDLLIGRVGLG